jgi:hypothetical protein
MVHIKFMFLIYFWKSYTNVISKMRKTKIYINNSKIELPKKKQTQSVYMHKQKLWIML